jgi:outer membrane immunogenic protein
VHQCVSAGGVPSGPGCDIVPDGSLSNSAFIGGAQAGYNWQTNNWVLGVEGDIQGTSLTGTSTNTNRFPLIGGGSDPSVTYTFQSRLDWLATLRGRVGVTSGSTLVYATGGGAFGGVSTSTDGVGPANSFPSTTSSTRGGWTAGAGIEWDYAQGWSVKAEGLYYDLGRVTSFGTSVPPFNTAQEGARYDINGWVARIGMNYRFGGPMVARY